MGDKPDDPVDHARTTRKHAGQNLKNTAAMPGLISVGLAVVALVIGVFCFAAGEPGTGVISVAAAVLLASAGFGWLARERRRVRRVEAQYLRDHPEADAETPSS